MALVAEAWPANKRARASSYVGLGWQVGVLAAALVTPMLLPVIGWRGMFVVGILPARRRLSHPLARCMSRRFSSPHGKRSGCRISLRLLVKDAETTKISLGMVILCSVQNFGYYGVMIWLPSYLSTRFGFGLTQSALWTAVTIAGMAIGIFCSATSPTASAGGPRSSPTCSVRRSWWWSIRASPIRSPCWSPAR